MKNALQKLFDRYGLLAGLAGSVVILDQATKALIRATLEYGGSWMPWDWLAPYARIVHWRNTGAAFGMGQNMGLAFTILAIVVVAMIIIYFPQIPRQDWPLRVALGLQLGGALGNLLDRLTEGYVTDFLSVGRFPVFNIADSSIFIGVVVLLIGMWIQEKRKPADSSEAAPTAGETPTSGDLELHSE